MQLTRDIRYALKILDKVGQHDRSCPKRKNQLDDFSCTCGYTEALFIAREALEDDYWVVRRRF